MEHISMTELIRLRYSCRTYRPQPIAQDLQEELTRFLGSNTLGPLGTKARFQLVAATASDRASLKGLGTYGFIKDAPGFLLGAVEDGPMALEGFGYLMERAILYAAKLGLGSCWLGGSFSKSGFARRIAPGRNELLPTVAAIGHPLEGSKEKDRIRRAAGSNFRLPPAELFFDGQFGKPIQPAEAGTYWDVLEAVRWAPSASNKQPWRLVRTDTGWHFYLERTKGYGKGSLMFRLLGMADLQRTDIGIAMCHFEAVARELGLEGSWVVDEPQVQAVGREYKVTWRPSRL